MSEDKPVNPEKIAVALKYERGVDTAPMLSAKGKGYIAESIIALAHRHGIEVREDADLTQLLAKLDVGMPIPVEAYMAVAEILSYVYRTASSAKKEARP